MTDNPPQQWTGREQLWVLRGRSPVLWTIPVYAKWVREDLAEIFEAVPLGGKQKQALLETLMVIAIAHHPLWRIERQSLERHAFLATTTDPYEYFSWERARLADQPKWNPEKRYDRDQFIDALYQRGIGKSRDEVAFWWYHLCQHALDWLARKEGPVDMYFCKLHASPYRQNWKDVMLGRYPRLGQLLCHSTDEARDYHLWRSGFEEDLADLDLLAMDKDTHLFYRAIEVEHLPPWWKAVKKLERERLHILRPVRYADYILQSVRAFKKVAVRIYTQWLAAIARPTATHVEHGFANQVRLVPHLRDVGKRDRKRARNLVPVVVANSPPKFQAASDAFDLHSPDGPMPLVPNLPPGNPDLRPAG